MTALTLDKQHDDDNTNKVKVVAKGEIISKQQGNNSETITIRIDHGRKKRSSISSSNGSNGSSSTDNNNKATGTTTVVNDNKEKTNTTINGDHDSNKLPDNKDETITYLKDASKDKTTVGQKDDEEALVTTTKDKDETLCISSSSIKNAICCCCSSSSKSNKKDIILEMLLQHKSKCNGYCEEYNDGDGSKPQKTLCRLCIRLEDLVTRIRLEKMTKKSTSSNDDHDSDEVVLVEDYHTVPLWVETTENYAGNSKRLLPYSQVHSSMLEDFDMNEVPTPAALCPVPCVKLPGFQDAKRIRKDYVISYSLYQDDLNEFPYYWLGLKLNIDAIKTWFPGWTIRLYVDENSDYKMTRRPFFRWMIDYAHKMGVPLEVIPTLKGSHPMLERYRPLMDMNTGVVLVRDIDSILTLVEAQIVHAWLSEKESDVLVYSEYKMKGNACGGGISMKMDSTKEKRKAVARLQTVIGAKRGRNYDECRLQSWLQKVTNGGSRQTIVQNRMNADCIYCIDFYNNDNNNQSGSSIDDPKILWSNARYHKYNPPPGTKPKTIYTRQECEEECQRLIKEIGGSSFWRRMHVYAHQKENRNKLLRPNKNDDRLIWCR